VLRGLPQQQHSRIIYENVGFSASP
jgi:hypothetical protein